MFQISSVKLKPAKASGYNVVLNEAKYNKSGINMLITGAKTLSAKKKH
jgi:hypothetical protein